MNRFLSRAQRLFRRLLFLILSPMDEALISLYCLPANAPQKRLMPALYQFRRLFHFLHGGIPFKIYIFKGLEAQTRRPLITAYLENGRGAQYMRTLLYGEDAEVQVEERGGCNVWNLPRVAEALSREVDLLIVERTTFLRWKPRRGEWVTSPAWVRMAQAIDFDHPWEDVERSFKKQKENIRRIKLRGYTYEISRKDEDFDFFLDRMHAPTIGQRHRNYGIIDTRAGLYRQFKQGFLMFIRDAQGKRVAASLNMRRGEVVFGVVNGFLDGNPRYLEEGAMSAIYLFMLRYCREQGIRRLDICEARPFSANGLYLYKKRWGFQPLPELWNLREWLMWVPGGSAVALDWLASNPFLPEFAEYGGARVRETYEPREVTAA